MKSTAAQIGLHSQPYLRPCPSCRARESASQSSSFCGTQFQPLVQTTPPRAHRPMRVSAVGWDPEGLLGPPSPGHIQRRTFQKQYEQTEEEKALAEKKAKQELEKRRAARDAREVPASNSSLVEFFLNTEAQEMEYEIARCRPRLTEVFFSELKQEIAGLRFAMKQTTEMQDRLAELEALEKVLQEGIEAYEKMAGDFLTAKDRLTKLLVAKDKKATLLEMAGSNELDRSLLALLDQNIAAARSSGQTQPAEFMEKVRGAMVKYITL